MIITNNEFTSVVCIVAGALLFVALLAGALVYGLDTPRTVYTYAACYSGGVKIYEESGELHMYSWESGKYTIKYKDAERDHVDVRGDCLFVVEQEKGK